MKIEISPELKSIAPQLALGVITARVVVRRNDSRLWNEIERRTEYLKATLSLEQLSAVDGIRALRHAYRSIGKDPARYRGSQEALIRRILRSQPLYQINTVVDINNLVSLTSLHSVGSYNLANLYGTISFRIGHAGEKYKGIGKSIIDTEFLPVFSDEVGAFGSPTSDSERALISLDTRDVMMVVIAFAGASSLNQDLAFASSLLREYAAPEEGSLTCLIVE